MQWVRRTFITGFFVTVPLFISVAALVWIFNIVDGLTTPLYDRLLGRRIPGLGTLSTAAAIVLVGAIARNVIGLACLVGGLVILIVERFRPRPDIIDAGKIPTGRAFAVGLGQTLALIPGVSRSGGTIVAAMLLRIDRPAATELSFFLAMPAMAAAFARDLLDVRHHLGAARAEEIAVGFVTAFIASALVVKPFLSYVRRHGFAPFAWYRILLGMALLAAVAAGWK